MIGYDEKTLNKKRSEIKIKQDQAEVELRKKLWNYLGDDQDKKGGKSSRAGTLTEVNAPKLSFEEIMREE